MKIPLTIFPAWIVEQYDLNKHALHGLVHLEMSRAVWRLPQAGILANKCLRWKLAPFGYHESTNTPGLWYHKSRPITFNLVVDDFGVKYVSKEDVNHLITSIKMGYTFTKFGRETYIAEYNLIGITKKGRWIYQCQNISRKIAGVWTRHEI
jgi:hypothetical protein